MWIYCYCCSKCNWTCICQYSHSCAGYTESNKSFYQAFLCINRPPALTFRLLFVSHIKPAYGWGEGLSWDVLGINAQKCKCRSVWLHRIHYLSCHRWGQVERLCPGAWQRLHERGLLAAGGLSAVAAPVIFLAFFPAFPPPLFLPSKAPDRAKRNQTRHVS